VGVLCKPLENVGNIGVWGSLNFLCSFASYQNTRLLICVFIFCVFFLDSRNNVARRPLGEWDRGREVNLRHSLTAKLPQGQVGDGRQDTKRRKIDSKLDGRLFFFSFRLVFKVFF